jgi:hypothetical protein
MHIWPKQVLKVLRFSDLDVFKSMEGFLSVIYEHAKMAAAPSKKGGDWERSAKP